jgi:hypothetical protein
MIGEIGGPDEAEAARWCKANMKKPIVGFIAGVTAPPGKRMGHAGALISGGADTADAKLAVMEECGFKVTAQPVRNGQAAEGPTVSTGAPAACGMARPGPGRYTSARADRDAARPRASAAGPGDMPHEMAKSAASGSPCQDHLGQHLLSGDNAVVIAPGGAQRCLPTSDRQVHRLGRRDHHAHCAHAWSQRSCCSCPCLKIVGALLLFWIGVQLLVPRTRAKTATKADRAAWWRAVRTILIADLVMSLDNVIAVAARPKEQHAADPGFGDQHVRSAMLPAAGTTTSGVAHGGDFPLHFAVLGAALIGLGRWWNHRQRCGTPGVAGLRARLAALRLVVAGAGRDRAGSLAETAAGQGCRRGPTATLLAQRGLRLSRRHRPRTGSENNEDAVAVDAPAGPGGAGRRHLGDNAGEVASGLAISILRTELVPWLTTSGRTASLAEIRQATRSGVARSNAQILETALTNAACAGMGTTLVLGIAIRSWSWATWAIHAVTDSVMASSPRSPGIIRCSRNASMPV